MKKDLIRILDLSKIDNPPKLIPGGDIRLPNTIDGTLITKNKTYHLSLGESSPLYNGMVTRINGNKVYMRIGNEV